MKRDPNVIQLLPVLFIVLAFCIHDFSPKQAIAKSLTDKSNALSEEIAFAPKVDYITGLGPTYVAIRDLDGDGKPDMVSTNYGWHGAIGNTISVLRNTSSLGYFSFDPKTDFATCNGPYGIAVADIDGDTKPDVVVTNYGDFASGTTVSVLRNTSSQGSISFAYKSDISVGNGPLHVAIEDLDEDGKADLVVTNHDDGIGTTVSVLGNTSTVGNISFSTRKTFLVGIGPFHLAINDIDGDTKPDIIVANNGSLTGDGTTISILRNTSTQGNISFAPKADFSVGTGPRVVAIEDLDGDGNPDVAVSNLGNYDGTTISVLRNTSVSGSISFEPTVNLTVGTAPHDIAIGDIDNDTKPDIVVTNFGNYNGSTISVLHNFSTSGNLNFAEKQDFTTGVGPHGVGIDDLDEDNKSDLAVANYGTGNGNTISLLRNISEFSPKTLTVSKMGDGLVTSSPEGIDCGSTCSASYEYNTGVTLTATPAIGLTFTSWSGVCTGRGTCTVTMTTTHYVTANFIIVSSSYLPFISKLVP